MVKQGHFAKTHVFEKDAFNSLLEDAKKGPSFTKTKSEFDGGFPVAICVFLQG